ncbi:MAG: hypothetical protein NC912_06810, partial [Candidatus Omnitrophica bacterium]|nr:hypothetical protein [Candidatus Omnitrophota bacterium]
MRFVFAGSETVDYLCELGITFYKMAYYDDALHEFKKILLLEPNHPVAKDYINKINQAKEVQRYQVMERVLDEFAQLGLSQKQREKSVEKPESEKPAFKVKGEVQLRLGVTSQDTYWRRANWDLNEKNWRILSSAALDRKENTYDPRIYERLRLDIDTGNQEGWALHSNIMVDPWSFTGKSDKITLTSLWGDIAEVELKYWSNTGYTLNETVNTNLMGNSFNLGEIKVKNGRTHPVIITTSGWGPDPWNYDQFNIPELKIQQKFQPIRELWLDYQQPDLKFRLYPLAYENQALTFDDPLVLSNNHIWWEESPWIRGWKPGNFNSDPAAVDFNKGYWDNSISFFARDSEGRRLTSLRGLSFEFKPQEKTSLITSIASPKTPWQDYEEVDNLVFASRIKHLIDENLECGISLTTRLGYNLKQDDKLDARNFVEGIDLGYEIIDGIKANLEVATSQSKYDLTNSQYKSKYRGYAYYFSLLGRFPLKSIMQTEYGYEGIQPEKEENNFTKFRIFACRMDDSFDASLSSYVETRDDEWWSRHISFRIPFKYYYQGEGSLLNWDDVKSYRIGNGIDIGRSILGLRIESEFLNKKIGNLFDLRNVHDNNGKFIENVVREEFSWDINERLTGKLLGIYHRLPKTKSGIDPFIFNPRTRRYFLNEEIDDGKDPSLKTGSLGIEYRIFSWLAINGIWERTNDISVAYDNFPRGILNGGNYSYIYFENGNEYRDINNWLNQQGIFPKPP